MRTLKIHSLPSDKIWIDRDQIMLHACFQLLVDCVEKEKIDTIVNYETHKEFIDEVRILYNWWTERVNNKLATEQLEKEDNEMLARLIKIRKSLWV